MNTHEHLECIFWQYLYYTAKHYYSTFSTFTHTHTQTHTIVRNVHFFVSFSPLLLSSLSLLSKWDFPPCNKIASRLRFNPLFTATAKWRRKKWINQMNMTGCELALRMYRTFLLSQVSASFFFDYIFGRIIWFFVCFDKRKSIWTENKNVLTQER